MNLYLISQNVNNTWDTYDSAVVCAENAEDAKTIHPECRDRVVTDYYEEYSSWASLHDIFVEYLGPAKPDLKRGVICASFNAG